jgi:hypothetical protein
MPYPIQPRAVSGWIYFYIVSGSTTYPISSYITGVSGNAGAERDAYYCDLQPGLLSVTLYNPASLISSGVLIPGNAIGIRDIAAGGVTWIYKGTISSVSTTYVIDEKSNKLVPQTTIEAADYVWKAANKQISANSLLSQLTETQTTTQFSSVISSTTGFDWSYASTPAVLLNQFATEGTVLDLCTLATRGINSFLTTDFTRLQAVPITTPSTYNYLFTDGTHGTTTIPTVLNMTDVDYGYSSDAALSQVTVVNKGLNRAPRIVNEKSVYDVDVPYSASQSIGYNQALEIQTAVATDNTGWNYIWNPASTPNALKVASTTYFRYLPNSARTRNNHGSIRCIIRATYPAGSSIVLMDDDQNPDMLTTPAGGTTGNWYFRFYAQAHSASVTFALTPAIQWLDTAGAVLSTSTGSAVTVNSATTWQAVTVNAAKPANAVYAKAYFNVGTVQAAGNSFYITDAYFGQQGAYQSYDGDFDDDASYLYTWTGDRWNSPTQRNTNNVTTLASNILARNTVREVARTVTINATQFDNVFTLLNAIQGGYAPVKVCVNTSIKNYVAVGYSFDITKDNFDLILNLVAI